MEPTREPTSPPTSARGPSSTPMTLERGVAPWMRNRFYYEALEGSQRVADADARVARWVTLLKRKHEEPSS